MPQSYRPDPAISAERRERINRIFDTCRAEWHRQKAGPNERADTKKIPTYAAEIENTAPDFRVDVLVMAVEKIRGADNPEWLADETDNYPKIYSSVQAAVAAALARKTLPMTEAQAVRILDAMFADNGLLTEAAFLFYPVAAVLRQIQKQHGNAVSSILSDSLKTAAERYRAFTEATRYSLNSADKKTLADVVHLCGEMAQSPTHKEIPMTQNQTVQISDSRRAEFNQLLDVLKKEWRQNRSHEYYTINLKLCPSFAEVEKAAPEYRVDLLIHCIDLIRGWGRNKVFNKKGRDGLHNYDTIRAAVAVALARKTLPMTEQDVQRIFAAMLDDNGLSKQQIDFYPLKYLINQIKKQFPNPSEMLSGCLKNACDRYRVFMEQPVEQESRYRQPCHSGRTGGRFRRSLFPHPRRRVCPIRQSATCRAAARTAGRMEQNHYACPVRQCGQAERKIPERG